MPFLVITTILLLTACGTGPKKSIAPTPIPRETAIVIGVTVPNPEEDQEVLERFQPLINYLAARLGRLGIQTRPSAYSTVACRDG